jgi:hypothetical protein
VRHTTRLRNWLDDRGGAFLPSLVMGFMIVILTSTAVFKGVFQAHQQNLNMYRRLKALQALQNEVEYWKVGGLHQGTYGTRTPTHAISVPIEVNKRGRNDAVLATFEPAARIRRVPTDTGVEYFEITVSVNWPEGNEVRRETITTAINPRY